MAVRQLRSLGIQISSCGDPRFLQLIAAMELYNCRLLTSRQPIEVQMRIAYIVGTAVATMKDEGLHGHRLLLAREADVEGKVHGQPFVAVDTVDAGTGDLVVITEGSSARCTGLTQNLPVDAVVVGVLDSLEMSGKVTFRKS
jgi:microcompartment protein CcmK/EutM